MGGGLMQLVAYGAQDIYLTGNPQITFFKVVYRRHTNFSMEHIQQTFKGTPGAGARVVATISRNGDLVHDCFLKVSASITYTHARYNPGHNIINNIECEIGGQLIDKHYGQWMEAHAELTEENNGHTEAVLTPPTGISGSTVSGPSAFQLTAGAGGIRYAAATADDNTGSNNYYVPLRFWFNRHVGLSLPLIALQYHEVNLIVNFSEAYTLIVDAQPSPELWANYIYLDTD